MRNAAAPQSFAKRAITILALLAAVILGGAARARAGLIGSGFLDGKLYDINPATGAATNPRSLGVGWALAFSPAGILYGITQPGGTPASNMLYTVNPATGAATAVAPANPGIGVEGDMAFDYTTGILYAINGGGSLYTVNTSNGLFSLIGNVPGALDLSAMAFDAAGNLYAVDTAATKLIRIDKTTAAVLGSASLNPPPNGGVAGLAFDPGSGVLYFASGSGTTDNLYTVNPTSGAMTLVGPLSGTVDGVASLAFTRPAKPGCCATDPPQITLKNVAVTSIGANILTLTATLTLPPNATSVTATILKNTFTYNSSVCPPVLPKLSNGMFFQVQPAATGISVQPLAVVGARELSWAKAPVSAPVTVTLPMTVVFQPPVGPVCTLSNPTRSVTACIVYRVTSQLPCGAGVGCSTCAQVKTYSFSYKNTAVLGFSSPASCP